MYVITGATGNTGNVIVSPKDIDFLVVVDDDSNLEPLARLGRKMKGRAQNMNRGADVFLADVNGKYIGRTCSWSECRPGKRMSCDALNCGKRHYLHDDLKSIQQRKALKAMIKAELGARRQ
jgi:hypothetical protein